MGDTIESLYQERLKSKDAMAAHMPTLRKLAEECSSCVEFGVRRANSTVALLAGMIGREHWRLHSYDLEDRYRPITDKIRQVAGNQWEFRLGDTTKLTEDQFGIHDLLFIDSCHNYQQVKAELHHADKVHKWILFHDTISHGLRGMPSPDKMGVKDHDTKGIMFAICEFLTNHREWREKEHYGNDAGLLVLERVS